MKKNKDRPQFRQGDVFIEAVPSVPQSATKQKPSVKIILAMGEVTKHHHTIEACDPVDWWKQGEGLTAEKFVTLHRAASVTHQEHSTIELPAGTYRVIIQREYSPEAIRNVTD